ncbi:MULTISPECIES: polymer-forming cytoskeletal protein [Haloferax]|uniref:Polymer-forming cytoskeletal protein n=1 Tax=Haloferax marinum TaxID=2666143 RepID=A0A6A8G3N8_9EURY|nr:MULTISPECIES: polymer-forming cytoskeletal protein [Haloferax]KAB1196537.1 polymer-forming cytoskeletal protein [Haloferax sp. CBA1150]MRW95539.1 polymer-forming cytoskeletal protein [Haloferax marinum]
MFSRTKLVAIVLTVLVIGSVAGVVTAQQAPPTGGAIVIGEGETYTGDLEATGGSVIIAGTVDGDVSVAAGSVVVTETGEVTGMLEGVAGSVTIGGTVGGDVNLAAGAILVRDTATIGGTMEAAGGEVRLDGAVVGDVRVGAETLIVGPTAQVGGAMEYDAASTTIDSAATIAGGATQVDDLNIVGPPVFGVPVSQFEGPVIPAWVFTVYWLLANFVVGAIIVLVAPNFARRVTGLGTKKAVRSGGVGLLLVFAIPIVLLVLLLTIIGIPLSFAGGVGFLLVLWVASIYGALVLGTWLLSLADYENRWVALFGGLFILALLDFVPLGGVIDFVVLLVGLGAFALALRGESADEGDESMAAPDEGPQEGSPMA